MGRRFYDGRETFQNLKTFNGGFSCKCKKFRQNKCNKKEKKSFPWTRYDVPQLIILASSSHGINIEKDFTDLHGKELKLKMIKKRYFHLPYVLINWKIFHNFWIWLPVPEIFGNFFVKISILRLETWSLYPIDHRGKAEAPSYLKYQSNLNCI